jgi:hypothetical protein
LEKNKQETDNLNADCVARKGAYTDAWTSAQHDYNEKMPLVDREEETNYGNSIELADAALAEVERKQNGLVDVASDLQIKKQENFDDAEDAYTAAVDDHIKARDSAAAEEKKYAEETTPTQRAVHQATFDAAKELIDGEYKDMFDTATEAKRLGTETCDDITEARRKHVDADDLLLSNQIKPLIDQLTNLKCVDAVTNDNFEEKKAAWQPRVAGGNLLQVASKTQSKCALTKSKMTSFIETSHFLGTISLDAQFQTFTDRVAAERTHMNTLHESCTTGVKTTFENEVTAATNAKDGKLDIIRDAQRESNGLLVTTLERLVDANVDYVKKKADAIADPLAAKNLAASALTDATSALRTQTEETKMLKGLAEDAHEGALTTAKNTKDANIKDRKGALGDLKKIASTAHDENKAFVDGYCAESKEDLKTEKEILKSIEQKLGGLLVTNDDKVGLDAENAPAPVVPAPIVPEVVVPEVVDASTNADVVAEVVDASTNADVVAEGKRCLSGMKFLGFDKTQNTCHDAAVQSSHCRDMYWVQSQNGQLNNLSGRCYCSTFDGTALTGACGVQDNAQYTIYHK